MRVPNKSKSNWKSGAQWGASIASALAIAGVAAAVLGEGSLWSGLFALGNMYNEAWAPAFELLKLITGLEVSVPARALLTLYGLVFFGAILRTDNEMLKFLVGFSTVIGVGFAAAVVFGREKNGELDYLATDVFILVLVATNLFLLPLVLTTVRDRIGARDVTMTAEERESRRKEIYGELRDARSALGAVLVQTLAVFLVLCGITFVFR